MADPRRSAVVASALLSVCVAFLIGAQARGIVSSNDGSHVALSRALWLRGSVGLGEDCPLTLGIDFAQRDGACYSDRPPGTAVLAGPAVLLGEALAPLALRWSRRAGEPRPLPAVLPFMQTYVSRTPDALPLARLIGTSLTLAIYGALMLLVGLHVWVGALVRLGLSRALATFLALILGTCTLWSCYATTLFSHNTTAALICVGLLLTVMLRKESATSVSASYSGSGDVPAQPRSSAGPVSARTKDYGSQRRLSLALGATLASVVCSEYAWLPSAGLWIVLAVPRRHWLKAVLGALPVAILLGAYHWVAFGAPWRTGYGAHGHFDFAHSAEGLLGGSLVAGLWTLWGAGRGAGLLVLSPVLVLAVLGWGFVVATSLRARNATVARSTTEIDAQALSLRLALVVLPYILLVALHPSPWGGEGDDHRYLIPVFPILALGLAMALQELHRRTAMTVFRAGIALTVGLGLFSAWSTWRHFWRWQDADPLPSIWVGALAVGISLLMEARWLLQDQRRVDGSAEDFDAVGRRGT